MNEPSDKNTDNTLHSPGRERLDRSSAHGHETAKQRERTLMTLFANVMEAGTLAGPEREAKIDESVSLILETPGFSETLVDLLLSDLDDEPDLLEEAREAMIYASDPVTGTIPDDHAFSPAIQTLIDKSPELRDYREKLVADAQAEEERRWKHVTTTMQPQIDALFESRRDRVTDREWKSPPPATNTHAEAAMTYVSRASLPAEGAIQSLYSDDPKGAYRLGETRIPDGAGLLEVILNIYKPGSFEPLVASRDDWRVFPMIDGKDLPTAPDEYIDTAWKIVDPISPEDLARVTYDVGLLTMLPDDEASEPE